MKCPKCNYLGFETGDRCKNCGYDFSLLSAADCDAADYDIHPPAEDDVPVHVIDNLDRSDADEVDPWIGDDRDDPLGGKANVAPTSRDVIDDSLTLSLTPEQPFPGDIDTEFEPDLEDVELSSPIAVRTSTLSDSLPPSSLVVPFAPAAATAPADEPLPLFTPAPNQQEEDDQLLIKLPPAPRPPLAVRRTPDTPRLRAVPRPMSRPSPAPVLQFIEELAEREAPVEERAAKFPEPGTSVAQRLVSGESAGAGPRLLAVAIDYTILLGIDLAVVYFTLRMAGLSPGDWRVLPATPMLTFLVLLKVAYFTAFTAVGGQTIGKMAAATCVIADDGSPVDAGRAMRRTIGGAFSLLLLGLGFVPALFGDHRALHDRLAGTCVVRLRSV